MARPQLMMLLAIMLHSLFCLCKAYYVLPNRYWPHQATSISPVSLPTTTTTAGAQRTIPISTGTPSIGAIYTGDITHYEVGLGSCGTINTNNQDVVALSVAMMANGGNPNTNRKCQTQITLVNPTDGSHTSATVVDTCQACAYGDVDLSPSLFDTMAPTGNGRVHQIQWEFDS